MRLSSLEKRLSFCSVLYEGMREDSRVAQLYHVKLILQRLAVVGAAAGAAKYGRQDSAWAHWAQAPVHGSEHAGPKQAAAAHLGPPGARRPCVRVNRHDLLAIERELEAVLRKRATYGHRRHRGQ